MRSVYNPLTNPPIFGFNTWIQYFNLVIVTGSRKWHGIIVVIKIEILREKLVFVKDLKSSTFCLFIGYVCIFILTKNISKIAI